MVLWVYYLSKRPISHVAADADNDMIYIRYLSTGYGRHRREIR